MYISFNSNNKFKGKCKIIINEKNVFKSFDLVDEHNVIYCSYKLKAELTVGGYLIFALETPSGFKIPIDVNKNAIQEVISYIIDKETDKLE